ncbi:Di-sulfide bridge nucleocytoplasmic transport domain-containing protein [Massariosphaeria phaeospora]|uniref:Di-sulfide bridge nucleocytoplasmic transport domain-containing protein n=1 Tax=Massariosphaeria phaeospora TaxID=100035 RepID=A0A7C8M7P4_9PLEO|nr:Di-sulfide bridge nucleocytoplasmic transport domain-containing protein [Massariosphaeria phaeospora]
MSRSHRTSLVPMDYEYDNKTGPVDQASPWMASQQPAKKRPHSVFDSPSKNPFSTPSRANSQTGQFSQNSKPLPSIPAHVQDSTWQPRTPTADVDCSSGGETPNTPAHNDDSEAATPDTQIAVRMGQLKTGDANKSPKKGRRDSWNRFKGMFSASPSPSKDKDKSRAYSRNPENRITKRRPRKERAVQLDDFESDRESEKTQTAPLPQDKARTGVATTMGGFLSWVEAHPQLPSVLSYYLQLSVNLVLALAFFTVVYKVWSGVMSDVDLEASRSMTDIMMEIAACARNFRENRCDNRVPAMEAACDNWESCMNRDPRKVARASVTARTFAMIFNSFVDEFSYKSMIFTAIIIFGGFNLSNWAFGLIRAKASPPPSAINNPPTLDHFNYPGGGLPATPQRQLSAGFVDQYGHMVSQQQGQWPTPVFHTNTPYGQHMLQSLPALANGGGGGGGAGEPVDRRSPSKRGFR